MHPLVHEDRKDEHCTVLCTVRPPEIRDLRREARRRESMSGEDSKGSEA